MKVSSHKINTNFVGELLRAQPTTLTKAECTLYQRDALRQHQGIAVFGKKQVPKKWPKNDKFFHQNVKNKYNFKKKKTAKNAGLANNGTTLVLILSAHSEHVTNETKVCYVRAK